MGGENSVPRKAIFKREFVCVEITMCRFSNTTLSQVPEFLQFAERGNKAWRKVVIESLGI
jgi:hypothetical protein